MDVAVLVVTNGVNGQRIAFAYPHQSPCVDNMNLHFITQITNMTTYNNSNNNNNNNSNKTTTNHDRLTHEKSPTSNASPLHNNNNNNNISSSQQQQQQSLSASSNNNTLSSSSASSCSVSSPTPPMSPPPPSSSSSNNNTPTGMNATSSSSIGGFNEVYGWDVPALAFLLYLPNDPVNRLIRLSIDDALLLSLPSALWRKTPTLEAAKKKTGGNNASTMTNGTSSQQPTQNDTEKKRTRKRIHSTHVQLHEQEKSRLMEDYTDFSIVFVFKYGSLPNQAIIDRYSQLLSLLVKTYEREQNRCMYIARELLVLSKLKEVCKDWESLAKMAQEKSLLARELITVANCIQQGVPIQIRINGWIEIGYINHVNLVKWKHNGSVAAASTDIAAWRDSYASKTYIKPCHACIVAEELPKLSDPPDGLNDVQKVMSFFSPTKSLQDVSRDSNMTIELVCSIAQHLVNWGIVRPITQLCSYTILVLSSTNAYKGSSKFPPSLIYIKNFSQLFPALPSLVEMMQLFSVPRTYQEHLESVAILIRHKSALAERERYSSTESIFEMSRSNDTTDGETPKSAPSDTVVPSTLMCNVSVSIMDQSIFAQAVFWLLKKNFIKPVARYIYMSIPQRKTTKPSHLGAGKQQFSFSPPRTFLSAETNDLMDDAVDMEDEEDEHILQQKLHISISQKSVNSQAMSQDSSDDYTKHSLTSYEMDYLKSVCNDRKMLNLFKRLCKYFDGQYHEQEIMWLESISQEEMNNILEKFSDVLLVIEL